MTRVEFVREVEAFRPGVMGCLVKRGNEFFFVSSLIGSTLAFSADKDGEVTSWRSVAGGYGKTREETIAELEGAQKVWRKAQARV